MADLKASLCDAAPSATLSPPLAALWWAAKGQWDKAHNIVMHEETAEAGWVHAYLHRVEGDSANAGYWYRRAAKPVASGPLETEWEQIATVLLGSASA